MVVAPVAMGKEIPFGVNEVRLDARQWAATVVIVGLILLLTPWLWERLERFDTGRDYRIPYQLSKDYWLYGRRLSQVTGHEHILVLGRLRRLGGIRCAGRHPVAFSEPGSGSDQPFCQSRAQRFVPARAGRVGGLLRQGRFGARK